MRLIPLVNNYLKKTMAESELLELKEKIQKNQDKPISHLDEKSARLIDAMNQQYQEYKKKSKPNTKSKIASHFFTEV